VLTITEDYSYAFVTGKGENIDEMSAFSMACFDAGLAHVNLVEIIHGCIPQNCKERDIVIFAPGVVVPAVFSTITRHRVDGLTAKGFLSPRIGAAVAIGFPNNASLPLTISKYSDETYGDECEERARNSVEAIMTAKGYEIENIQSVSIEIEELRVWGSVFAGVVFFK
jgi:pyruvoyl-dependent arginine decarboxylase